MLNSIELTQFAFVPIQLIIDNIILTFKIIHYMKRKTRDKKSRSGIKGEY